MKKHLFSRLLIAGIVSLFIVGCNAIPQAVRNIFATDTPTPTNTATSTSTPTNTPTATATPLPAVDFESCSYKRYCEPIKSIGEFIPEGAQVGEVANVTIPYDQAVSFHAGWVAAMSTYLEENIQHIHWVFEIDGQDYYRPDLTTEDVAYQEDGAWPSIFTGVKLTGWKVGEPHRVRIGFYFDDAINDGWEEYASGYGVIHEYVVNPVFIPTDTPTLTPSPTLTPKPRPTQPPWTATPACKADSVIHIENATGGQVTLYLTGPASFTFYLATGNQDINVCRGSYSYTAYGCGGASRNGTIGSGDRLKFYCQ